MSTAELNEQSTTEEVNDYVEKLVEEIHADQEGEEKSDAQITSEHVDTEQPSETTDETESVSDAAPEEGDAGDTTESGEWLTDDVKAEVAAYGLEESDLAGFDSREELDRALTLFNKDAIKAGRDALDATDSEEAEKKEPGTDRLPSESRQYTPLNEDVYDEEVIQLTNAFNDRIAALEQQLAAQQAEVITRSFDSAIDSLENSSLFGKTGDESKQQMHNRRAVHAAVSAQMEKIGSTNQADYDRWVGILAKGMFAEDFEKRTIKNHTRKISRQANGRQGGGATRPSDPPEDPRDEFDRKFKELSGQT